MASKARDIFIDGLRNAHAMETQARELMERQSERLTDYPDVRSRVQTHLRETEQLLASPDLYRDGERVKAATREFEETKQRLQQLYEHWEEAVELN